MAELISRDRLQLLLKQEEERFLKTHKKSKALFDEGKKHYIGGVPMIWMMKWAGGFPLYVKEGKGGRFVDVDGNKYIDFCLGDTGAMTGHSPDAVVKAVKNQVKKGLTFMLPSEDSLWIGKELTRRFGLPFWQATLTATDANRFAIRLCRMITKRNKILVFNYCYHGTVDETFVTLDENGQPKPRRSNMGPPVDPSITTKVIEFNDVEALKKALADRDVACVLCEPAMTNIGIVHPQPGYHDALRKLTKETGTLLIIDETHTICAGPGGYTKKYNLQPDVLTIGKPIGGGVPASVYGVSAEVSEKFLKLANLEDIDVAGIGGTLAGNALSLAAIRATLEHVLTDKTFDRAFQLAQRFVDGVEKVIKEHNLPWHINLLGCRAEYWFRRTPPKNGKEAADSSDFDLDRYMHLACLNRGILMTPFHNMALICSDTTDKDVDYHTQVFREIVEALLGKKNQAKL